MHFGVFQRRPLKPSEQPQISRNPKRFVWFINFCLRATVLDIPSIISMRDIRIYLDRIENITARTFIVIISYYYYGYYGPVLLC